MKRLILVLVLMSIAFVSQAENAPSRYAPVPGTGTNYNDWHSNNSRMQELIDQLNSLINDAEQARAADPRFLRDLRNTLAGYDWPWTKQLLRDDFSDGDFTQAPAWVVAEGQFQVEPSLGLHSLTQVSAPAPETRQEQKQEDLGNILLGALLEELDDGKSKNGDQQTQQPSSSPRGLIHTAHQVPNSFAMQSVIASHDQRGRIELGLYRESASMSGYRLAYVPGERPALELLRVSERGVAVIEAKLLNAGLEDGRSHQLQLTRDKAGYLTVILDNAQQFRVRDRSYQEDFKGVVLVNDRGDFSLRSVTLMSAE